MVLGTILKLSTVGAAVAGVVLFLTRAAQVGIGQAGSEVGEAIKSIGEGGSALGAGIQATLTGIGVGAAKLFDPLFTLKTLIYGEGNQGTVNVNPQTIAVVGDSIDSLAPTNTVTGANVELGTSVILRSSLTGAKKL